MNVIPETSRAH